MKVNIHLYTMYEYEATPLALATLPAELTAEQKVALFELVDELYANTDQETTDWSLEYQLWVRMMVSDRLCSVPVNTFAHHLMLGKVNVERICNVLGKDTENAKVFRACAESKALHKLVCDTYKQDPDCYEGFIVVETGCGIWELEP